VRDIIILESIKVCIFVWESITLSVNDYEILIEGSLTHGAWNLHDFLLSNLGHSKKFDMLYQTL
jgi:hypothetical protein